MLIGEHRPFSVNLYMEPGNRILSDQLFERIRILIFTKGFWASTECNGEESEF
jgi:hypothetical protein